ncbi:hypothetical protein ACFPM0_16285 [Pseudonocardia sulfidoxydans]|uniref:hypothetical protein n=1 Tax=Pseudonocardia sulfidoxydans TaxID=54011 RepID=UPI003621D880
MTHVAKPSVSPPFTPMLPPFGPGTPRFGSTPRPTGRDRGARSPAHGVQLAADRTRHRRRRCRQPARPERVGAGPGRADPRGRHRRHP